MERQTAVISFDDYVTAVWKPRHEAFAQGDPKIDIGPHKTMLFSFHEAKSTPELGIHTLRKLLGNSLRD